MQNSFMIDIKSSLNNALNNEQEGDSVASIAQCGFFEQTSIDR